MTPDTDVLVIGAGPAGMTAALQLHRAGLTPLIVERDRVGGALLNAGLVENYPGFPGGISGSNLVGLFHTHLCDFLGVQIHKLAVGRIERQGQLLKVFTSAGEVMARYVVIATGTIPLRLNIPGEDTGSGKYVFHDLRDFHANTDTSICVIGGGDVAFDYALSLNRQRFKVKLVMRSAQPRCLRLLANRVAAKSEIAVIFNHHPERFEWSNNRVQIHFNDRRQKSLSCDGVLVAIGREPTQPAISLGVSDWRDGESPLFFAGDVVRGSQRQVGIAVGDGLRCAMEITQRLSGI